MFGDVSFRGKVARWVVAWSDSQPREKSNDNFSTIDLIQRMIWQILPTLPKGRSLLYICRSRAGPKSTQNSWAVEAHRKRFGICERSQKMIGMPSKFADIQGDVLEKIFYQVGSGIAFRNPLDFFDKLWILFSMTCGWSPWRSHRQYAA